MSTAKHTPGPWRQGVTLITRLTQGWSPAQIEMNDRAERRMVYANFSALDEGRSRQRVAFCERVEDARLIAAAPELLEALRPIAEHGEISAKIIATARAAIANATGSAA